MDARGAVRMLRDNKNDLLIGSLAATFVIIATLLLVSCSGCGNGRLRNDDPQKVMEPEVNPDGTFRFRLGAAIKNRISGEEAIVVSRIDDHAINVIKSGKGGREADRWYDVECDPVK